MNKFSSRSQKNSLNATTQRSSIKNILPVIILTITMVGSYFIYHSGKSNSLLSTQLSEPMNSNDVNQEKKSKRQTIQKKIRIVNTQLITVKTHTPTWQTTGVVKPAQTLNLKAEVAGVINNINPNAIPGALIEQGKTLLTLKDDNFQYSLINKKSLLIQAQSTLAIEKGNQVLALEAFAFMQDEKQTPQEKALILREPQIASAMAKVTSNQASVAKAEDDLAKTKVIMPFTGKIQQRNIALGANINASSSLYQVLNVDKFWLEVKIPRHVFSILDKNQPVLLTHQQNNNAKHARLGTIMNSLAALDNRDRQVKLLITIDDPLLLKNPPLKNKSIKNNTLKTKSINDIHPLPVIFINDFLFLALQGKPLNNTVKIKPHWLIANDYIWVVDQENTLKQRKVNIVFKGKNHFFVRGDFVHGDHALTDKLSIAVSGMKVKKRSLASFTSKEFNNDSI